MPGIAIVCFRETDGTTPLFEWFDALPEQAVLKCMARVARLGKLGHELRRPEAEYLRDGIYELRARHLRANYRILYFFHKRKAIIITHGFLKRRAKVPEYEIKVALRRKAVFEANPSVHSSGLENE